jgi:F-type H+-transporting ATPase subunit b
MGDIFNQIGQAFVQAIPTVVFVGLLVFILRRLFFGPLRAVLKAREQQSKGALERARERTALAESKAAEYEAAWLRARREVYSLREQDRRAALSEREEIIRQARAQTEATVREAQASLTGQSEAARAELARASENLAAEIVEAILGRRNGTLNGAGEVPW